MFQWQTDLWVSTLYNIDPTKSFSENFFYICMTMIPQGSNLSTEEDFLEEVEI